MRTIFVLLVALTLTGCQPAVDQSVTDSSSDSRETESSDSVLDDIQMARSPDDLHSDEHIESLVDFEITATSGGIDPDNQILDVVPAGESHLRSDVFKKLQLDESKLADFRTATMNMVDFLTWQVSPSYDITCM